MEAAAKTKKHVYCEKPLTHTVHESRVVAEEAKKRGLATQLGTQIHAGDNYRRVVEIVRSGILGDISMVRNTLFHNEAPDVLGNTSNTEPPDDLDWDMWLGPAQERPYNQALFQGGHHRYFKDLAGSWLHDMGGHILDLPFWALELGPP